MMIINKIVRITKSKKIFCVCIYEMYLISSEGYTNAGGYFFENKEN